MLVDDDSLDLLRAHDRADATTRSQAHRPMVGITEGDARQQTLVLSYRAAEG